MAAEVRPELGKGKQAVPLGHTLVASVALLGAVAIDTIPREPPNGPASGPIVITAGGTYSGHWASTGSTPPVRIQTTEPVTIRNAVVVNRENATLIQAGVRGSNVTIERVYAYGGAGRFFSGEDVKTLVVTNSDIIRTGGIYVLKTQAGGTISVTRNRQRDVQGSLGLRQFLQLDQVTTATIDVSWNEIVNSYGRSRVEDNISLHRTAFAKVHDNYIQGGYPSKASDGYAGSGIMVDSRGSHDNEIYSNQIVETTNAGIGIAGGYNNKVYDNRLVSDGRLTTGERLAAANVGVFVWNSLNDSSWSNNQAYRNYVAWVNGKGGRNDWWLPHCTANCGNIRHSGTVRYVTEFAEWVRWLRKLEASKIKVGR